MISTHADVVGSLLRPASLIRARDELAKGVITQAEFKRVEDRAVNDAVSLQQEAGLKVVTDGEMRRLSFQSQMTEAVNGFGQHDLSAFLWGDWYGDRAVGDRHFQRPASLGVISKLSRKRHLSAEEFAYLRGRVDRAAGLIPKITLPSPSLWANFWSAGQSASVYSTLDSFLADVVDVLRDDVAELARLGATYIQIDAPHYTALLDPATRSFYEGQGWSLARWLQRGIEMDNAVIGGFPQVTFGFHL